MGASIEVDGLLVRPGDKADPFSTLTREALDEV